MLSLSFVCCFFLPCDSFLYVYCYVCPLGFSPFSFSCAFFSLIFIVYALSRGTNIYMLQARYTHRETQRQGIMRALMHAKWRFWGNECVMSNNGISVQVSFFISLVPLVSTERVFLFYMLFLYLLKNHVCCGIVSFCFALNTLFFSFFFFLQL